MGFLRNRSLVQKNGCIMAVPVDLQITDPEDFKDHNFQNFDRELRCGICFEFLNTAMMITVCSHNFCSLCINRYPC